MSVSIDVSTQSTCLRALPSALRAARPECACGCAHVRCARFRIRAGSRVDCRMHRNKHTRTQTRRAVLAPACEYSEYPYLSTQSTADGSRRARACAQACVADGAQLDAVDAKGCEEYSEYPTRDMVNFVVLSLQENGAAPRGVQGARDCGEDPACEGLPAWRSACLGVLRWAVDAVDA